MKFMKHLPCNERQSENARIKKKKSNEEDLKMRCRNNCWDRTIMLEKNNISEGTSGKCKTVLMGSR